MHEPRVTKCARCGKMLSKNVPISAPLLRRLCGDCFRLWADGEPFRDHGPIEDQGNKVCAEDKNGEK